MSSSIPLTPQQKAQKWATIVRWGAYALCGFLFFPFALATIKGMLGLIACGLIAGVTWTVLPALQSYAVNMRLKMIKAEAAKNPIESLQAEYLRRDQLLEERKGKIETLAAKTAGFSTKLAQFKRDYPGEEKTYQDIYDKMVLLLKRSREQWVLAEKQLTAFDREIDRAKAKWDMALAAADLRQDAGQVEAEFFAKLKVECSFEAIEFGMNSAFAQLDTLLMESESVETNATSQAALPAGDSRHVIDVTPVATKNKVSS